METLEAGAEEVQKLFRFSVEGTIGDGATIFTLTFIVERECPLFSNEFVNEILEKIARGGIGAIGGFRPLPIMVRD